MDAIRPTELHNQEPRALTHPLWLVLLFLFCAILRLSSPNDFFEGDQNKQVGYVMDLLHHGNWATQFEVNGIIATKPPLYNWIAAGLCRLTGTTAPWVIKLPSFLAGGLLLILLYQLTRHFLDQRAAFFACVALIASHHFTKLMWFARTDMLMVAGVYLAITLLVIVENVWWKSPLLGLIMAASALTKGPVGPALFAIFVVLWSVRQGIRPRLAVLKTAAPGLFVFAVIITTWLMVVSRIPDFHESVLHNELARRLPGSSDKTKPFYYYISHLFTRVAPWSAVGAIGACFAYRKREQWPQIRFLVIWATAYFVFFSAIPAKRHDLLLPVYPVVFMLAGFALNQAVALITRKEIRWSLYISGGSLAVAGLCITFLAGATVAGVIALATFAGGVLTIFAIGRRQTLAIHALALTCLCAHGVYYHWANVGPRVDYREFTAFLQEVKSHAGDEPVLVYHAHPLISYELDLHEEFPDPRDLLEQRPHWLIAPAPEVPIIESWTRWKLQPVTEFNFHGKREIDATLYRVEPTPLAVASRGSRDIQ